MRLPPHIQWALLFLCVSGLLWQLPVNWLLFLPVAVFWTVLSACIAGLILILWEGW